METIRRTLDGLRQTDYTGENRCLPCTVLNVFLALVFASSIAFLWVPAGITILVGGLLVIYFRGYLVPKTPTLTARYLPDRVLGWFGKTDPAEIEDHSEKPEPAAQNADTERLLRSVGVVETDPTPDTDDLQLTDTFYDDWWRRIRRLRDEEDATEQLAEILEVDSDSLSIEAVGDTGRVTVSYDDRTIAHWISEAALYADLAVEPTLREWLPQWDELDDDQRTNLIAGLRPFLEECPRCEADLETVENVRKSCCSDDFVSVTVDCEVCGSQVFTGSYN